MRGPTIGWIVRARLTIGMGIVGNRLGAGVQPSTPMRYRRDPIPDTLAAYAAGEPAAFGPLRLASSLEGPASDEEIDAAGIDGVPDELRALWRRCRTARLYGDVDYGQWGMVLLSPARCRELTQQYREISERDAAPGDLVVCEFLGDWERAIYARDAVGEPRVLIADPLECRADWSVAGPSLVALLQGFLVAAGDKYWEFHLDRGARLRKAVHDQVALLAGRLACPVPSPAAIDRALVRAIAKHATANTVASGILTRTEAVTLVIAHLQSDAIGLGTAWRTTTIRR